MTDNTAFFREVDEDVRREQLERLWKKYGRVIVGVAILAIVGTGVFTVMRNQQNARFETATSQVAEVLQSIKPDNHDEIRTRLAEITPNLPEGQAAIARLYSASLAASSGKRDDALNELAALSSDNRVAPLYRDLAKLNSIQLRLDTDDAAKLRAELEPLMASGQPWRFSARESAALLAIKTGDKAAARDLYQQLKDDADTPTSIRDRASKLTAILN